MQHVGALVLVQGCWKEPVQFLCKGETQGHKGECDRSPGVLGLRCSVFGWRGSGAVKCRVLIAWLASVLLLAPAWTLV